MKLKLSYLIIPFILVLMVLVVYTISKKQSPEISTKKDLITPMPVYNLEISNSLEPLSQSIFKTSKRPFKKTTPQEASDGFNFNTYEYYQADHHKYSNNLDESLFYKIYSKDNGIKNISDIYLYGKNFNKDNCGLFSFLEVSNTMFIICRDNIVDKNSQGNYFILGFATLKNDNFVFNNRELSLIMKEKITAKRGEFVPFFDISITQVSLHKYYLTTSDKLYLIKPATTGTQLTMQEIKLKYYQASNISAGQLEPKNTNSGWAIKLTYNQMGNLLVFSSNDGVGIIDTLDDRSLDLDKSCFVPITSEMKKEEHFYNDSVDPFLESPYKSISEAEGRFNTYEQTVSNAGCLNREGYIRLYRNQDSGYCDINLKNELIGC